PQVGEEGPLVVPRLNAPIELRKDHHRHVQIARQITQLLDNLPEHPDVAVLPVRPNELQVVHYDDLEVWIVQLLRPRYHADLLDRQPPLVYYADGQPLESRHGPGDT